MLKQVLAVSILFWSSIAVSNENRLEIAKAIFDYGISKMEVCKDCDIEYLFFNIENEKMNEEFFKHFFYTGLSISSSEHTKSDCDSGITSIFTHKRGYAFSIFEIEEKDNGVARVKWGHWYSCKNYSNEEAVLKYLNGNWNVVSSSGASH